MKHEEALFLRTLDDLAMRVGSADPYEILGAAALLRKLLIDDYPLVDQVNRQHRVKILFEVANPIPLPPGTPKPVFESIQDGIDPDTALPSMPRRFLNRDQFFSYVLTKVGDHEYTLREVVLFEANVMGGVHAGSPRDEKETALRQIESQIAIGGLPSSLRQLQAIGRVVLKSLSPLADLVHAANGA